MGGAALLFSLVTLGSLISSLTGLGGGTLVLAGLLVVYPPELAIPLHAFTQLSANGLRTGIHAKTVDWKIVFAYGALMLPFAWIGAKLFDLINPSWLKLLVGLMILISILPLKFKPKGQPGVKTFMIVGAFSGFLGIFVGAVGPMVTPFFNRLKLSRDGNIATKSAGQLILQASKIAAFGGAAGINFMSLKDLIGLLIVGTLIGVGLSVPLSRKISDQKFDLVVNLMLGLISIKILIEGSRELYLMYF